MRVGSRVLRSICRSDATGAPLDPTPVMRDTLVDHHPWWRPRYVRLVPPLEPADVAERCRDLLGLCRAAREAASPGRRGPYDELVQDLEYAVQAAAEGRHVARAQQLAARAGERLQALLGPTAAAEELVKAAAARVLRRACASRGGSSGRSSRRGGRRGWRRRCTCGGGGRCSSSSCLSYIAASMPSLISSIPSRNGTYEAARRNAWPVTP